MSAAQPAPDLPVPDRRAILGGSLALASAVAASAAVAASIATAASPTRNLDVVLIDLGAQLTAAVARQQQHDRDCDAAYKRYRAPPIPNALFYRPEDRRDICDRLDRLSAVKIGGEYRRWYEDGVSDLSSNARRFISGDERYKLDFFPFTAAHEQRARDIVEAHAAWTAAVARAEEIAGIKAASDGGAHEECVIDELRRRIAGMQAHTLAGLIVKAQAAAMSLGDDHAWIIEEYLPEELASWATANGHSGRFKILVASLVVDLLHLSASPAATAEAA